MAQARLQDTGIRGTNNGQAYRVMYDGSRHQYVHVYGSGKNARKVYIGRNNPVNAVYGQHLINTGAVQAIGTRAQGGATISPTQIVNRAATQELVDPGTPGVRNDPVQPFFTPDDLLAINAFESDVNNRLADYEYQLEQERINKDFELQQAEEDLRHNRQAATDEMIGRGLFASSIRDATLYDLEGTFARQRTLLNDRFEKMRLHLEAARDRIVGAGGERQKFWEAMNQKAVENAAAKSAGMPEWKIEPRAPVYRQTGVTLNPVPSQTTAVIKKLPSQQPRRDVLTPANPNAPKVATFRRQPQARVNETLSDRLRRGQRRG